MGVVLVDDVGAVDLGVDGRDFLQRVGDRLGEEAHEAELHAVLLLEHVLVLGPQLHHRRHVDLVEGGEHRGGVLRFLQPPRDGLAQLGHPHALFARRLVAGAGRARRPVRSRCRCRRLGRLRRRALGEASSTSPFSTWPRLPEPASWSTARLFSAISLARRRRRRHRCAARAAYRRTATRRRPWRSRPRPAWPVDAASGCGGLRDRCRLRCRRAAAPPSPKSSRAARRRRPFRLPWRRFRASVPAAGAGTSTVTLSVSSSTSGSSAAMASPTFLNHLPMVASVTDSPRVGTRISVAIVPVRFFRCYVYSPSASSSKAASCGKVLRHQARSPARRRPDGRCSDPLMLGVDMRQHPFQIRVDERPGAHVLGLLLAPHHLGVAEARQLGDQRLGRERIELFDAQQVDVVDAALLALLVEVVIDLARAQHDAADLVVLDQLDRLVGPQLGIVPQQPVERAFARNLRQRRHRPLVAEQRLRRHQDQRLAEVALQLPAQDVEVVGRRRAVGDLHVVFGAKLQEALEPGRRVLRPLALIAVRQQADEAGHAQPLALARGDELVEDHLRAVGEVAELRFPQGQRLRLGQRIAVLEAQHGLFREHRVDDLEVGLRRDRLLSGM